MPATCCVIGCNNRHSSSKNLRFYRIPRGKEQRCKFIEAIARHSSWEPNNSTRICSIHFELGSISKNKHDVDYAPTLFMDIGKDSTERGMRISLHENQDSTEPNETEFRDHITKLIDEASIMLKQREDNCLSQSLLFHDYIMPYHNRPIPEYVEPKVCTSVSKQQSISMDSISSWHQTDNTNVHLSSKDITGRPLDVVMMMSSSNLHSRENLEHIWVADTLLKMGSSTYIDQPNNTLCSTTTADAPPVPDAPLSASAVHVVL